VGAALDGIGAPWYVGGSVASSLHGIPRATQDADVVAALRSGDGRWLVETLGAEFYADSHAAEQAIGAGRSFNVIHLQTMFKIDVFVLHDDAYGRRAMSSRLLRIVSEDPAVSLPVATAEDTVAHKLYWYRLADERSEKQWRDLVGVLKTLAGEVDVERLRLACADLGVDDLVDAALIAAGAGPRS
jgi:hypothetical protein